jgi:phage baseplate assembly protein gpV
MQTGDKFIKNLLNALLPNRAAPTLGRVLKVYEGPGKTAYSCDVRVLKVGTLEDTDQDIAEVPISPMWASQKKRGVYCLPQTDQVVIVEFLMWNPAYPFIAGIWGDDYEADTYKKDQFLITDGDGMKFIIDAAEKKITVDNGKKAVITWEEGKITVDNGEVQTILNGDKFAVKNGSKSLFTVLKTHIEHDATMAQNIAGHKTVGSPAQHVVSPDDITKFTQDKTNFTQDGTDLAAIMEA